MIIKTNKSTNKKEIQKWVEMFTVGFFKNYTKNKR